MRNVEHKSTMPSENNQRWTNIFTIPNLCIALGVLLLYFEKALFGIGFVLAGLILRVEWLIREESEGSKRKVSSTEEELGFGFNLTAPWIEAEHGWENVTVYPMQRRFQREICFGGPPVTEEAWEYDLKEDSVVVCRLLDRYEKHFGSVETAYTVVNSTILEGYSSEKIAIMRKEVVWHELHGAIRYFILSKHDLHKDLQKELKQLRISFAQITTEAEALGRDVKQVRTL